ncbi:MAG: hypothetical protein ACI93N_001025 [Flavobacteriaceae bacterium]|jgi:hypothetical protein
MNEIFFNTNTYVVIIASVSIFLWMDYEKKIRVVPSMKGVEEGGNRLINLIDLLLVVGAVILLFSYLNWWQTVLSFIVLFFLSPFISGLISFFFNAKTLSVISILLKFVSLILLVYSIIQS